MKVLDLFSGVGGFSLGLERAGMETVAFCEFDKHAQKVLKKHWPDVPIISDIKDVTNEKIMAYATSTGTGKDISGVRTGISGIGGGEKTDRGKETGETESRIDLLTGGFPCQ